MIKLVWRPFEELYSIPLSNGLYKTAEFRGNGIKIINMGELFEYSILDDVSMKRVTITDKEKQKFLIEKDDLIFARRSLKREGAGKCSIINTINEPTTFESSIIRVRLNKKIADPWFYYYFFNSKLGRNVMDGIIQQVAVSGIRGSDLSKLRVPYIPVEYQVNCSKILKLLDFKILINTKINYTLEQIAQTIFKHWFIDFEFPNENNKSYKSSGGKMKKCGNVLIPSEWKMCAFSEIREISREYVNPNNFPDETFDHFSIPAYDDGQVPKIEEGKYIKSNKFCVTTNCVLLSRINPRIPRVWLPNIQPNRRAIASSEFLVMLPKSDISLEYLFVLCSSPSFMNSFSSLVTGSTGSHQRANPDDIQIVKPAETIIRKYTRIVYPLLQKIRINHIESGYLRQMRDMLLSKLMIQEFKKMELMMD